MGSNVRKVDFGLFLTVLTICGVIWAAYAVPASWNQAAKDIAELKPIVLQHDRQLTAISVQYTDIKEELHAINKKLGR